MPNYKLLPRPKLTNSKRYETAVDESPFDQDGTPDSSSSKLTISCQCQ